MEIHRIILTKAKLAAVPQAERSLLLLSGHASNEINVLSKLIQIAGQNGASLSQVTERVQAGQACVLLRVLIGQLHESWELFRNRVLKAGPFQDTYLPLLDSEGTAALNNLKRHFGGSTLTQIRNKVAFHYSDDDNLTEQSFQTVADTEPLELYLTTQVGNSFYYASEVIVMSSALRMAAPGTSNDDRAFAKLCDHVIAVSRDITELFGQLIATIVQSCMPDLETHSENHPDGPKLSTLNLPYFIEFDMVTQNPP